MSECIGLDAGDYNTRTAHLLETKKNAKKLLLIGGTHTKMGATGNTASATFRAITNT